MGSERLDGRSYKKGKHMRKYLVALSIGVLVLVMTFGVGASVAAGTGNDSEPQAVKPDDLEHPLGKQQRELRAKAA